MKIHWLSPLPPAHTGIAEASAALLPELAKICDLHIWTSQESWDPSLQQIASISRLTGDSELQIQKNEIAVYQMGNNLAFHSRIWGTKPKTAWNCCTP
jgi:hypothetical protein